MNKLKDSSLISLDEITNQINNILKKNYPLPIKINKINNLSHFFILPNNPNKILPFQLDINGKILDGKYKNYQIIKVHTISILSWNKYILKYISLLNKSYNPYINEYNFLYLLHTLNFICELNINKVTIKNNDKIKIIDITYISNPKYNLIKKDNLIIDTDNHFIFESFNINKNYKKLKIEIMRLIKNRDKYNSIHFHLDNNGGGDIVPAHIILRCLVCNKEKWMKNIRKILTDKT